MPNNESVYAPPKSEIFHPSKDSELTCDGNSVVAKADTSWPARCYICNHQAHQRLKVKVTYLAWWLPIVGMAVVLVCQFLLMRVIEPLICLFFLQLFMQKKIRIALPVCDRHKIQRQRVFWVQLLGTVLFVCCLVGAFVWSMQILVAVALVALVGLVISAFFYRKLYSPRHQDGLFWIKGTGQAFRDSLPPFY